METCSQTGGEDPLQAEDHRGKEELAGQETKDSKPLAVKHCGVGKGSRNSSLTGKVFGNWD